MIWTSAVFRSPTFRGGISVIHHFPADGEYDFELWFEHTTTGEFYGNVTPGERLEIFPPSAQPRRRPGVRVHETGAPGAGTSPRGGSTQEEKK